MNITILVYGSFGDVQPYVALGAGLQRAGHHVTVAGDPFYESLIRGSGLGFAAVSGNPLEIFESEAGQIVADSQAGLFKRMSAYGEFNRTMKAHLARNIADTWPACKDAEAFIFSFNAVGGYHVAEKLGVPAFAVGIAPFTRTRSVPSINFAPRPSLGGGYNLLTHNLTERIFFVPPSSHMINKWRTETLGIAPLGRRGYMRRLAESSAIPVLYSFSPELMPKPADWPEWVHVTGYWFPESGTSPAADPRLVEFLAAGPPPVYVGFGSMSSKAGGRAVKDKLAMVCKGLADAGQRGIVSLGADATEDLVVPPTVFRAGALPHDWLFPQVSMTVHHGGSGTTSQSLRAGVPMVTTPFMWDQPFWSRRVHEAGLGPAPIPHKQLTPHNLAQAIRDVLGDPAMRARARQVGERVRAEHGVDRAVALIEERLRSRRPSS